jgi:ATP-dependent phosphofructokinase / diphosphate-dependent phosphofructokinase
MTRRISIGTGGGDAPGFNAVIRAVTLAASGTRLAVSGIRDGYNGLLKPERTPVGASFRSRDTVRGITHLGGTILGTTNRGDPLSYPVVGPDGRFARSIAPTSCLRPLPSTASTPILPSAAMARCALRTLKPERAARRRRAQDDRQRSCGNDRHLRLQHGRQLRHPGVRPAALHGRGARTHHGRRGDGALRRLDRPLCRRRRHGRRYPDSRDPLRHRQGGAKVNERNQRGYGFSIVVVAEGAKPAGGELTVLAARSGAPSGWAVWATRWRAELETITNQEARVIVLGHLQRGGSPTTRPAAGAALRRRCRPRHRGRQERHHGLARPARRAHVPLGRGHRAYSHRALDSDIVLSARDLGISFGD